MDTKWRSLGWKERQLHILRISSVGELAGTISQPQAKVDYRSYPRRNCDDSLRNIRRPWANPEPSTAQESAFAQAVYAAPQTYAAPPVPVGTSMPRIANTRSWFYTPSWHSSWRHSTFFPYLPVSRLCQPLLISSHLRLSYLQAFRPQTQLLLKSSTLEFECDSRC